MHELEISTTIGHSKRIMKDYNFFENIIQKGCNYFRFNLSKCRDLYKVEERIEAIYNVFNTLKFSAEIMLDIPFPGRKPRIFSKKKEHRS